jgi:Matrixin
MEPAPVNREANLTRSQALAPPSEQKQYLAPAKNAAFADPEIAKIVQLLPLTNESAVTFVRMEPPNTNLDQVGDYFETVTSTSKHRLLRFQHMPVPIYITPFPERDFIRACNGAFEMWEQRSNGIVRFTQVEDPAQARIRVIWSHLGMGQHPNDCVLGAHTITQWNAAPGSGLTSLVFGGIPVGMPRNTKYVVQPQVIEVNLDLIHAKPEELRLRLLRNVVAHELGHAVGLMGHSPQRSDLMNALTDECSRLSQRDVNTLRKLYNSPADIWL